LIIYRQDILAFNAFLQLAQSLSLTSRCKLAVTAPITPAQRRLVRGDA
jgi:hypothetical protein